MNTLKIISRPDYFRQEPRGWSFSPFRENPLKDGREIDWASFHTVSMEPGSIRGNHVHLRVTEWLLFCGGPLLLIWQEEGEERIQQKHLEDQSTYLIIPPGVKHAVQNRSQGTIYLVAFRSLISPAPEPETLAAPLL